MLAGFAFLWQYAGMNRSKLLRAADSARARVSGYTAQEKAELERKARGVMRSADLAMRTFKKFYPAV